MNMPLAAVVIDPGPRTYLVVNDHMCRVSGYSEEELVGMPVSKLNAHPPDEALWSQLFAAGVAAGAGAIRKKDGTVAPVEFISSLTKVGGLDFVIGFFWDPAPARAARADS